MWALFAIPANQSFPLKTSATTHTQSFLPQLWILRVSICCQNARVQWEEVKKKSDDEEGKKQREQINSHSHGADCCPRWAWPCWHHGAGQSPIRRPLQASGLFLPSLIPYSLLSCCLFLLFLIPAFLTSFLLPFYTLSLSLETIIWPGAPTFVTCAKLLLKKSTNQQKLSIFLTFMPEKRFSKHTFSQV